MEPILNPNLRGFYESSNRYYVLYGGRSSGKTYHTAGFCVFLAANYKIKFLCVRQFQNRLADSVKSTIEECIDIAGLSNEFYITSNEIRHVGTGSTFAFYGINRNLKEIKGTTGVEILWIEEAEGLTEEQWRVIMPTIRAENSKIFIVFNPRLAHDFVYKRFVVNPPVDAVVRKINYDENPYLSKTMKKVIADAKNDGDFNHVYLGEPLLDDDAVIIKRSWIMSAIDAHIVLNRPAAGSRRLGFDVADSGADKCATIYAHGHVIKKAEMWNAAEDELLKSCARVYQSANELEASIAYDSIGVGATAGAKFGELNITQKKRIQYSKFNAGGAVFSPDRIYSAGTTNRDMFSNIKAQAWWLLADRFRNTFNAVKSGAGSHNFKDEELISISSDIKHLALLIDELSTPKRDYDQNGRVKVESKKDLARREIASPNLADASVMAISIFPKIGSF